MPSRHCHNCMNELTGSTLICPKCGFDNSRPNQPAQALPCGTILQARYLIGRMLGQGGFGITYIGYDYTLEIPVCIKEFFPSGGAMRGPYGSSKIYWSSDSTGASMKQGRETFVKEARKAAKVRGLASVVNVWDVFYENDTAYIVMEYIKGVTVKEYLVKRGSVMEPKECIDLFEPVIHDLQDVHDRGIVHRDISPDNLMLSEDGKIKLLDLGAAKDLSKGTGQSSTLVAKKGFSPPEQYTEQGNIGPWTDVYAICATIYWCMTGKVIPEALERLMGDTLSIPESIPGNMASVLRHGLEIKPENRTRDLKELVSELKHAVINDTNIRKKPGGGEQHKEKAAAGKKTTPEKARVEKKSTEKELKKENLKEVLEKSLPQNIRERTGGKKPASLGVLIGIAAAVIVVVLAMNGLGLFNVGGGSTTQVTDVDDSKEIAKEEPMGDPGTEGEDSQLTTGKTAISGTLSKEKFTEWADRTAVEVSFLNSLDKAPSGAEDLSEEGNRSVLGWMDRHILYIAGEGGVQAPEDCSFLFSEYDDDEGEEYISKYCWTKLTTVKNAEYLEMSKVLNTWGMFYNCKNLQYLDVSKWNTSNVKEMRAMFSQCNSLTKLDVSKWDTSNVNNMWGMFSECSSLTELDISDWNTSNVNDMGRIFDNCNNLTKLDVSDWNTSNVTNMGSIFYNCNNLTKLNVSKWNTSNVNNMAGMFNKCGSLTVLDVSDWDISNVDTMGSGFNGMFEDCSNLTELKVSNWNTSKVENMSNVFTGCSSLTELDVKNWDTSNVCDMWCMFEGCSNLTELDVSKWDTSSVTDMTCMFAHCRCLTKLDVSKWNTSKVEKMSLMFEDCPNLTELDVSAWDTSSVTNKDAMFEDTIWENNPPF